MHKSTGRSCVYYRYAASESLDVNGDCRSCLSAREFAELAGWRNPRRRIAWLRGRMLAKQLIVACLNRPETHARIEILSRDAHGRSSRPEVWCDGVRQSVVLSISHTDAGILVALAPGTGALGVDVTRLGELPGTISKTWFTRAEQDWAASDGSGGVASLIWAAKEAVYKACNRGESFAPREVEIRANGRIAYRGALRRELRLQSWQIDRHIVALASSVPLLHRL